MKSKYLEIRSLTFALLLTVVFTTCLVKADVIYIQNYTAVKNETLVVPIYANVSKNIEGLDVLLKFDPHIVEVRDVKLNRSYQCQSGCFWFKNVGSNFVKVVIVNTNGIKAENIPVVDIVFRVIGNPGETTELKLHANESDFNYTVIKPITYNGYLKVTGQSEVETTTPYTATATTTFASTTISITTTTVTTVKTTIAVKTRSTTVKPTTVTYHHIAFTTALQTTLNERLNKNENVTVTTTIKPTDGFGALLCAITVVILVILRKRIQ
jgi:hypothetical protein